MLLQRRIAPNGVVFYASPLLEGIGVPHAFSTRIGGTSPPPFDSLNLGNPIGCGVQDDYPRILSHYPLLQAAAGCPGGEWCRLHQVHGDGVVRVKRGEPFDRTTQGDALVSDDATRSIAVRVADCVPVLLATRDGRTVGAVHAGWRGTVAGVLPATLRAIGAAPSDVVGAIGPCISFEAFEVGGEVLDEFVRVFGSTTTTTTMRRRADGKGYVDLRECLKRQLLEAGLRKEQIDTTDRCTYRDRDEFYSHRRDRGITGRMAAIIAPLASK
jgi:YfiH family protein